ncbi:MAG: membrane integrity-associated transporter subunit PqiC [Burkholderiales bacterium]|nr:membrane integrity-associated transporter subunit PqiC [Burkholderiales bacterium]
MIVPGRRPEVEHCELPPAATHARGGAIVARQRPPDAGTRRQALRRLVGACGTAGPLTVLLGACAGPPRTDYHLLRDPGPAPAPAAVRSDKVLLLASGSPASLYDTERMVFSVDGSSRSYFQFGYWAERPQRRLLQLAEERLVATGAFRDVALSTAGIRGELLLTLRLESLYLDDAAEPGQARLAFAAELVDWRARRLLGRRRFAREAEVRDHDAAAFAAAASGALGELLGELAAWVAPTAAAAG